MRMLATLLLPDSGDAQVLGHDIKLEYRQIRKRIGYMPGKFSLYMDLTVGENLHFFATLFGTTVATHYDLIAPIYEQLAPFKERRAGQLSGGMKQKLALCCALIHKPDLLLLDEPTTGVDTVSRKEFWDMLALLSSQGMTLLVSTPYMDEAARCQRIALMQTGEILAVDSPEAIIRAYPEPLFAATASNMALLLRTLRAHHAIQTCFAFGENVHFTFSDYGDDVLRLLKADMLAAGLTDFTVDRIQPSIEDCFIQLMHP
jgi:ABC-type multidrug transport system ATPase subunit